MPLIKAVVFDSDGTLMNSFDFIVESYQHIARTFGYPEPTADEVRAKLSLALPLTQILQDFCPGHPLQGLLQEFEAFHAQNVHTQNASIVHCDRVQFGKPHPEGFLLAVEECGSTPEQTIMIGDSPNDILAGKNGQAAQTIGITHGNASRSALLAADPDYIVADVPELEKLLMNLIRQEQKSN